MAGLAIAVLFMLMVAAPCLVAMRNSRANGITEEYFPEGYFEEEHEADAIVYEEPAPVELYEEIPVPVAAATPRTRVSAQRQSAVDLREAALEAEMEALMAKDRADRAHWEALTAAARVAALRADAAAEAAQAAGLAADRAMWAAESEFEYEMEHPPMDNPPARISGARRRAA